MSTKISCVLVGIVAIFASWSYFVRDIPNTASRFRVEAPNQETLTDHHSDALLPNEALLPVSWGDLGPKMASVGAVDKAKFLNLYNADERLQAEAEKFLLPRGQDGIAISSANAPVVLNLFWALGLGNKNEILVAGPMRDPRYGGAGSFASTGGWILAEGPAMDHYARHPFVQLDAAAQEKLERVAKNIYRPCCNNPAYFPDCNHGMAMIGLLELAAGQGASEDAMYRAALAANSLWFPDQYRIIAGYFAGKGIKWENADPRTVLAANVSGIGGFRDIEASAQAPKNGGGGSCGV